MWAGLAQGRPTSEGTTEAATRPSHQGSPNTGEGTTTGMMVVSSTGERSQKTPRAGVNHPGNNPGK